MNAEQTERLLRRACMMIEVDQELKVSLRKALLTPGRQEGKTKTLGSWLLQKIESLYTNPRPSLQLSIAPWL